jgi:hypothetical protein
LGISGLDSRILAFSTPENAPTEISLGLKKKLGKKKGHKNHSKIKSASCLLCWAAGAKKKVGAEQEKVAQVFLASAYFGLSDPLANETSQHFRPCVLPFAHWFLLGLFLTRVSQVRIWVPFN